MVALVILTVAGPLGAFDVLYYHLYKFRLHARPESRGETVTHLVRGLLIGGVAILLALGEPHGAWFWAAAGLLIVDFANDVIDVLLEPASRKDLGGLPPLEYLTHVIGAAASGGATAAFLVLAWPWAQLPTELAPASHVPSWLAINGVVMGIGAILLAAFEATLMIRALPGRAAEAIVATK